MFTRAEYVKRFLIVIESVKAVMVNSHYNLPKEAARARMEAHEALDALIDYTINSSSDDTKNNC